MRRGHLPEDPVGVVGLGGRAEATQRRDLAEVVDLVYGVEVVLHALDGDVLARLDALGLEHFGEGALADLRNQPVLCRR